jgi:hypothetical protein
MRHRALILALLPLACHSSSTTPNQPVTVDLTLNDAKLGSQSCSGGMFFTIRASNVSSAPVQVRKLSLSFTPKDGDCTQTTAPISSDIGQTIAPGQTVQVRRVDLAGQLCSPPDGAPGCSWAAAAAVTTDDATATDAIAFATYSPADHCESVVPAILTPANGATVSGTVGVTATVVEGDGCIKKAFTMLEAFSETGEPAFASPALDRGQSYSWDTRSVSNGRYWITAFQRCCGIRSAPIVVTVHN